MPIQSFKSVDVLVKGTSLPLPPLTCGGRKEPITSLWERFLLHGVLGDTDSLGTINIGLLLEEARMWTGMPTLATFCSELVSWTS